MQSFIKLSLVQRFMSRPVIVLKEKNSVYGKLMAELQSFTCHTGSQCHLPPDTDKHAPP